MFSFGDTKDNLSDTLLLAAALWITGVAEWLLLLPPCRKSDDNSVAELANLPLTSSTLLNKSYQITVTDLRSYI